MTTEGARKASSSVVLPPYRCATNCRQGHRHAPAVTKAAAKSRVVFRPPSRPRLYFTKKPMPAASAPVATKRMVCAVTTVRKLRLVKVERSADHSGNAGAAGRGCSNSAPTPP